MDRIEVFSDAKTKAVIHEIPFPSIIDELLLYAQHTTREINDARIRHIHTKCLIRGKIELAKRIALKYGKIIDKPFKDDRVMAFAIVLAALNKKP